MTSWYHVKQMCFVCINFVFWNKIQYRLLWDYATSFGFSWNTIILVLVSFSKYESRLEGQSAYVKLMTTRDSHESIMGKTWTETEILLKVAWRSGPGFGQAQQCGGVKLDNRIPLSPSW